MHLLTQSSSDSDDDNDFDPPFATSLPRNHDFVATIPVVVGPPMPLIPVTLSAAPTILGHTPYGQKAAATYLASNGMVARESGAGALAHIPMCRSTRDQNGKYQETRKPCRVCKKRINTFCRNCKAALCFLDGNILNPESPCCWEKYHLDLMHGKVS